MTRLVHSLVRSCLSIVTLVKMDSLLIISNDLAHFNGSNLTVFHYSVIDIFDNRVVSVAGGKAIAGFN
jgi:hypothetical protein